MLTKTQIAEAELAAGEASNTKLQTPNTNPARAGQKMLIASAGEHAELGRDYLRAGMPGFALNHLRQAVERLEQAAGVGGPAKIEDGGLKMETTNQKQGLIEL